MSEKLTREQIYFYERRATAVEKNEAVRVHSADLAALCQMALAYLDATDWRPIETAPRDGTRVLVVLNGVPMEAYWSSGIWRDSPVSGYGPQCASHWLPLPQPPKEN